jgi:uncharacterized membrane protein
MRIGRYFNQPMELDTFLTLFGILSTLIAIVGIWIKRKAFRREFSFQMLIEIPDMLSQHFVRVDEQCLIRN